MKKILSFILAALLLASSVVSCGKDNPSAETQKTETSAVETQYSETEAADTEPSETEAPDFAYATDKITENGAATAHIVVPDGTVDDASDSADQSDSSTQVLKYASEELVTHIKLVSGADVAVTNEVQAGSLPIIIATPDSYPELEELFPDDLAWLRDTGNPEENVRFGDDGFAIRMKDGKLYIFGATARGTLNGVYDFIEDNMGVLWTRAEDMSEFGTIYDEMPTIMLEAVDYREKSPFDLRSWTLAGSSDATQVLLSRNKLNAYAMIPQSFNANYYYDDIGMEPFITNHNITWWLTSSPSYDSAVTEYWSTGASGIPDSPAQSQQVNFWSDVTMQCIADSVLAFLDRYYNTADMHYIGICLEDLEDPRVYPAMTEPYEYAPGEFVYPEESNYISTVVFSFMNQIARIVGEKYPDVNIHTYAYACIIEPPKCDIEENFFITICPIDEDLLNPLDQPQNHSSKKSYESLLGWIEKTPNIQVYNYYGCYTMSPILERPFWWRIQSDLQLYAANGFNGLVPEGHGDGHWESWGAYLQSQLTETRKPYYYYDNSYAMNAMTYWIYAKLAWNPYEDVDALIDYYCDKAYGEEASEYVKEYYRLLKLGMEDGRELMNMEFNMIYTWWTDYTIYWDYFLNTEVDGVNIVEGIRENLHKAYDAATEKGKERLKYIVDVYDNSEAIYIGSK